MTKSKIQKPLLQNYIGLEEYLNCISTNKWKQYHNGRTFGEAYNQIKLNLEPIQKTVLPGAMADGIRECIDQYKNKLNEIKKSSRSTEELFIEFLSSDHIIFLNDHGPEHIQKVIERAYDILRNATQGINEFETFILLCAIQIHDIGNVFGRAGHEKKLHEIFDEHSKDIIMDTPEKRVIKNIAMAHGGKTFGGSKDTISSLCASEMIFESEIRTRFLAAVLRLADELADDSTRANRSAMDFGILGIDSQIYHDYSRVLHTVKIKEDTANKDYSIILVYELEASILSTQYNIGDKKKYLLDEIYDRTLKMEQERRYCMKFMHPFINIGRIDVKINIYGSYSQLLNTISYQLEDISYPDRPKIGNIKEINETVPSGEEELCLIRSKGEKI